MPQNNAHAKIHVMQALQPVDINGTGFAGDYVSMKNFGHLTIIINQATCGATPAVTLSQALTVAGGTPKALAFTEYFLNADTAAGNAFTRTTVTANTFNLANDTNRLVRIEVNAEMLDLANNYDCVSVLIANPGAPAVIGIEYILSEPKFASGVASMPNPKLD